MAFEEIKAKLGLDITAFQQNASKAQGALKTLAGEATKKFTDMKQVGQAAATALGISYQAIADGIARFVIGFSKDQEQALNDLVDATDKAADAQEAAFKRAQDARKKLLQDIADKEEEYRRSQLTDDERSNELGKRLGEIMTERNKLEKQGFQTSDRYLQLKNEQLDVEKELRGLEAKKSGAESEAISANEKKAADAAAERLNLQEEIQKTEEDTAKIGKTDAELIADMEQKLLRLKQERDRTPDKDERLKITLQIAKKEQEIKKAKQDALDVTTKETIEIFDRIKKLKKEKVDAAKPTLEGIESGERKAPYETRQLVKSLRKNEADRIKAADTLVAKNVAYNKTLKEGTESEKRRAKAELDAAKFNFEQLGKQQEKLKEQLVGQGVNIGEDLIPEAPKPVAPKPEAPKIPEAPKPVAPMSAAQAALTAAQGQVTQAQNQLTAPPTAGGGDIASILGNIKTGIDNLNDKLESTAIK